MIVSRLITAAANRLIDGELRAGALKHFVCDFRKSVDRKPVIRKSNGAQIHRSITSFNDGG
ncbi:hypothetical protein QGN29_12060 [Temperatibacter marinus]|uniref:Uncharacterized protein n=1 Tax=Temperatibacter marinus TaxID=1456591 RepID=A0AA52EBH5_9PROT|nr:hypothetical protein [Temperatibacter marinus]WND02282.1 hypothetical protein QGN29_12060 [Temperatibacter marinus]